MSESEKKARIKFDKATIHSIRRIMKYMNHYRTWFIFGMVCLSLSSVMFMLFPAAAGEMANTAAGISKYPYTIHQYGLFFVALLVFQGVLSYGRAYAMAVVAEKGMAAIRSDLYRAMISQPVSFFEANRVGELTSRITGDVEQLQNVFSVTLAEFIRQLITLVVGVAILAWITPKLSLIMLLTFPVIVLLAIFFGRYIRRLSKARQEEIAHSNAIVEESLQSFNIVKAFTNEFFEINRYRSILDKIVGISLSFARTKGVFFVFIITVLFGGIFFILWRGALMVAAGDMAIGDLFSFIIYTGIIGAAIASLGTFYTQIAGALGAGDRILEILDGTPEITMADEAVTEPVKLSGTIQYNNVHFSYPARPEAAVLKGIDIEIPQGSKIALVGASGAGKSTIVSLLMRFHQPTTGNITIGNKDINTFDLRAYRSNFAIVPQDVILFGGSIRENIAYGNPKATDDEIRKAAEQANAWQFIESFSEGLDTIVGDRGIRLSGGQKQRIAIARAIIRDPAILILDEATSSLDAESEQLVQEALESLMVGRTSVIIAHRLATIRHADNIYVIRDGRIVESGTHDGLISQTGSWYGVLAAMQQLGSPE